MIVLLIPTGVISLGLKIFSSLSLHGFLFDLHPSHNGFTIVSSCSLSYPLCASGSDFFTIDKFR